MIDHFQLAGWQEQNHDLFQAVIAAVMQHLPTLGQALRRPHLIAGAEELRPGTMVFLVSQLLHVNEGKGDSLARVVEELRPAALVCLR